MKVIIINDVGFLLQIDNPTYVPRKDEHIRLNNKLYRVLNVITNYNKREIVVYVREV